MQPAGELKIFLIYLLLLFETGSCPLSTPSPEIMGNEPPGPDTE